MLLHGLLFDGRMWRHQVEPLSALGRVIVLDGPGHGKSEDPPRFALEDHAEALFDIVKVLGIDRAVLVGLSWGGMISMRFSLKHPDRVRAMCLMDTSAEVEPLAGRVKNRLFISVHRRVGLPMSVFNKEVAPLMFGDETLRDRPELVEQTARNTLGFSREGIARASLAVVVHRKSILEELGKVRTPTLVICGEQDRATTPDKAQNIARAIPGAELVMIPGAGHMSALEAPERVNKVLLPFVERAFA
jgi:3-oxoadipate enol-lactonase